MDPDRSGIYTTEFWISIIVVVIAAIQASPLVSLPYVQQGIAIIVAVLAALGYTMSRAIVKASRNKR